MNELTRVLKSLGTKQEIARRTIVLKQGETPTSVCLIHKGVIKTYSLSSTGEEQIIRLLTKNDMFTIPWIFGNANHSLYYYEAQTDCVVVRIEKQVFLETVLHNPRLQAQLVQHLAGLYTGSMVHITALEQSRAQEKILTILYYLCLSNGVEFKPGKFKVKLQLTHAIIASLAGLTRETAALELGNLKKRGVIHYTSRYYLIDKLEIERLLDEDSFANVALMHDDEPLEPIVPLHP